MKKKWIAILIVLAIVALAVVALLVFDRSSLLMWDGHIYVKLAVLRAGARVPAESIRYSAYGSGPEAEEELRLLIDEEVPYRKFWLAKAQKPGDTDGASWAVLRSSGTRSGLGLTNRRFTPDWVILAILSPDQKPRFFLRRVSDPFGPAPSIRIELGD